MPDAATERELNDRLWERAHPLLPPRPGHPGGRPFADDRACFEGIVHVLRNGLRWRQMPTYYPSGVTCWRRHRDWTAAGAWHRVWKLVLRELDEAGKLDTSEPAVDGTFIEAKQGGGRRPVPAGVRDHARTRHRPDRDPARGGDRWGERPRGEPGPGRPCRHPGDRGRAVGRAGPGRPGV